MAQFRTYFFDLETRKEITDFAGNGKTWLGTSGGIRKPNGEFDKTLCTHVDVANWANFKGVDGERRVTFEDFGREVAVKIWFSPTSCEWRKLVK